MLTREATPADLEAVAAWITSPRDCRLWAGPDVTYPLHPDVVAAQIDLLRAANLVLSDDEGVAAFGQLLLGSPGRAHLARVIVRPDARGRGLGRELVAELLERARTEGRSLATLSVYPENVAAVRLYEALGFVRAEPPAGKPATPDTWYMTRRVG